MTHKGTVRLETEQLILRHFTPDDWESLHEYLSQPETVRFEPYEPYSVEESKLEAIARSENAAFLAVCLRSDGKLIGNVYLEKQEYDTWELGYVFNRKYCGNGYATDAAKAALAYAFDNGARRVTANCNPLNKPSWRLLDRLGLSREGHLRKNIYFKYDSQGHPVWQDTYEYAILAEDYFAKAGEKEMSPIPLGVYRHYKGNQYEVVGFAKHSETLEDMVIYKALYGERGTWVRPLSMWSNVIDVDGKTVKRFELISEEKV